MPSPDQSIGQPAAQPDRNEMPSDYPRGSLLWAFEQGGCLYDDWRGFVVLAIRGLWQQAEVHQRYDAAARALIEDLAQALSTPALEPALQRVHALDDLELDHWVQAIDYAALLGYALGRTAEPGMERFDGWLERARRLAFPNGEVFRSYGIRRAEDLLQQRPPGAADPNAAT